MKDHELDHSRLDRLGFPEIVYGEFKTSEQLNSIASEHQDKQTNLFVTRLQEEKAENLIKFHTNAHYDRLARTLSITYSDPDKKMGLVGILSAGTSDVGIVKETKNTLSYLGYEAIVFNDVGVAGIHRLLDKKESLKNCDVLIVVAGFEGALPSVVGGLYSQPIIAVPTSVGYGVAIGGTTALHAMLTSCANGILVTNIDNGCGGALSAVRILNRIYKNYDNS